MTSRGLQPRAGFTAPRWRRAVKADIVALRRFLSTYEERRVGFSGRLLRDGEIRLPSPLRGAVWILDVRKTDEASEPDPTTGTAITGAVLCHPSRLVFPVFPPDEAEGDLFLASLTRAFAPASAIGMASDLSRYESALGLKPLVSVAYRLMTRGDASYSGEPDPLKVSAPAYSGLSIRRASLSDLDALLPLQEAYEHEEVLTPIHGHNRSACKASLARALERQLVFVAEEGGVAIGKAATNARGFRVDQVGGVYTLPQRRGRGVAAALMTALLGEIYGAGKRPSLFVKPGNVPARALYRRLGFEEIGDYRADYFEGS
jgi:GNAT superfamily N-acetyltransferase